MKQNKENTPAMNNKELIDFVDFCNWHIIAKGYVTSENIKSLCKVIKKLNTFGNRAEKWIEIGNRILITNKNVRYIIQSVTDNTFVTGFNGEVELATDRSKAMKFKSKEYAEKAIFKIVRKQGHHIGAFATLYKPVKVRA